MLVDTSIWIDYLSTRPGTAAARLDELVTDGTPFALTPIVLEEILQGPAPCGNFRDCGKTF